jgi:hypothetical protein
MPKGTKRERAIIKRRAKQKKKQEKQAKFEKEMNRRQAVLMDDSPIPTDKLPKFIQEIMNQKEWVPRWNACYTNAMQLGCMLDDAGYDVQYCEAVCEQGDYEKKMGRLGKGHCFSHAWLRVNGRDYNISANEQPLTIYAKHRMLVMPIKKLRLADDYEGEKALVALGKHKPYIEGNLCFGFNEHPDVKPYVAEPALPEMLTEYISTLDKYWEGKRHFDTRGDT